MLAVAFGICNLFVIDNCVMPWSHLGGIERCLGLRKAQRSQKYAPAICIVMPYFMIAFARAKYECTLHNMEGIGAQWLQPCCRAASVLPPWNSRCKIELIFGVMLQFNVVWCIHSRREIVLTIQSDNGKQGYKVGGEKYRRPKVVLSQRPLRTVLQRLDSETRGILSSQRVATACTLDWEVSHTGLSCHSVALSPWARALTPLNGIVRCTSWHITDDLLLLLRGFSSALSVCSCITVCQQSPV